jgi:hypothetical protein
MASLFERIVLPPAVFEGGTPLVQDDELDVSDWWLARIGTVIPRPTTSFWQATRPLWATLLPGAQTVAAGRVAWEVLASLGPAVQHYLGGLVDTGPTFVRLAVEKLLTEFREVPLTLKDARIEGPGLTGLQYERDRWPGWSVTAVRLFFAAELQVDVAELGDGGDNWISIPERLLWHPDASDVFVALVLKLRHWHDSQVAVEWASRHPD